jgi:hypothetical protein
MTIRGLRVKPAMTEDFRDSLFRLLGVPPLLYSKDFLTEYKFILIFEPQIFKIK